MYISHRYDYSTLTEIVALLLGYLTIVLSTPVGHLRVEGTHLVKQLRVALHRSRIFQSEAVLFFCNFLALFSYL